MSPCKRKDNQVDPISEFPSSREISGVGNGRAAKSSSAEGKRVPIVQRTIEITVVEVSHQDRRRALNVLTMRRKNSPRLHGKLVPLQIPKMYLPLLNGKLVPLMIIRVVPLHGKLVPPLILLKFWVQPNGKLVPQLFLAMRVQAAMIRFSMVVIRKPNLANMVSSVVRVLVGLYSVRLSMPKHFRCPQTC